MHSISRSTAVASTRSKYSVAIICFCCWYHLLVLSHLNQQRHIMVFICLRVYHEIILLYYFLLLFLFVLVLLLLHKNLLSYIYLIFSTIIQLFILELILLKLRIQKLLVLSSLSSHLNELLIFRRMINLILYNIVEMYKSVFFLRLHHLLDLIAFINFNLMFFDYLQWTLHFVIWLICRSLISLNLRVFWNKLSLLSCGNFVWFKTDLLDALRLPI